LRNALKGTCVTAIAGIVQLDSRRPDRAAVERMSALLTPHGSDAQNHLHLPTGALLRTLCRIVPEDSMDSQPMHHHASGSYGLFDGRLDNRDELGAALGIPAPQAALMADSALAFRACMRWDTDAPSHLLGDFAIACWNPRKRRLWLARDPLGSRPLFWHRQASFFAFATMPKALFAIPGVPRAICEERLADFLALLPMQGPESLFKDVFRVEPGQWLLLDADRLSRRHYHRFDPERRLVLGSDEEYVEAFREQLVRAVSRRLRSIGPVAAHLSSGFDSSTVTALAAKQLAERHERLIAYTAAPRTGFAGAVPPDRHADESPGARALVARHANIDHVLIRSDGVTPLDGLQSGVETGDGPPRNPCNFVWINGILKDAASRGVKVILTGAMGNMTVSHAGVQLLPTLLRAGRLARWWREARAYRRCHPPHRWRATVGASVGPLLPSPLWWVAQKFFVNRRYHLADYTAMRPEFEARMGCAERARDAGWDLSYKPWADSRRMRIAALQRLDMGERFAAANAAAGLETRDPTCDVRLAEFCLAVPDEQFLRDGKDRWLLRRTIQDLLPPEILDARTKGLQAADWYEGTAAALTQIRLELDRLIAHGGVGQYLNLESLRDSLDHWPTSQWNSRRVMQTYRRKLLRGLSVGMFIRYVEDNNE
jgi:asparagine synthase (glutamine-hydrolysing)